MKKYIKIIFLLLAIIPIMINATENYNNALLRANNYINTEDSKLNYSSRNKYLIYGVNTPYSFSNGKVGLNPSFRNGGLLNREEFLLSVVNNSSYLLLGLPYWTMTQGTNGYYSVGVVNLVDTEVTSQLDTRVTEYVKPNTKVKGSGSYSDPWYFVPGYQIKIATSNENFGYFGTDASGKKVTIFEKIIESGQDTDVPMVITKGYKYAFKDDCNIKKTASTYKITNVQNDINCVAYFNEKVFELTLDKTNTSASPNPDKVFYKYNNRFYKVYDAVTDTVKDLITQITPPKRVGYTFNGYTYNGFNAIDSTGVITNNYSELNKKLGNDKKITLQANWIENKYTVKFDANSGSGSMSDLTNKKYTETFTLPENKFTKAGYHLTGWNTKADGNGKSYNDKQSVSKLVSENNGTITLYAQWDGNTYTASFNKNGVDSIGKNSLSCKVTSGSTCTVASPSITRSGFTIDGWNTSNSATSGTKVGENITLSDNTTYYAITHKDITITFDKNGNTVASSSQKCTMRNTATSCSITSPTITAPSGFSVIGYSAAASTHTSSWAHNTKNDVSSNATYYAQTKKDGKTIKITFNKNGNTVASDSQTCSIAAVYNGATQSTTCSITSPTITAPSGFSVIGYSTAASTHTSSWAHNTKKDVSSNATYYAQTKKDGKKITITFNVNSNQGSNSTQSCTTVAGYNGTEPETSCSVTSPNITPKSGYSTVGWNTSSGATTSSWNINTSKSVSADATYYAIVKQNKITCWKNYDGCAPVGSKPCSQIKVWLDKYTINSLGDGRYMCEHSCYTTSSSHSDFHWRNKNGTTRHISYPNGCDGSGWTKKNGRCEKTVDGTSCPSGSSPV